MTLTDQQRKGLNFLFYFQGGDNLSVKQVWPDGDAPEKPTTEDVIAVIEERYDHVSDWLSDWRMASCLHVFVNGREIEWKSKL